VAHWGPRIPWVYCLCCRKSSHSVLAAESCRIPSVEVRQPFFGNPPPSISLCMALCSHSACRIMADVTSVDGDGIPKCSYRKAHLPIFAPTQIMVEFRIWGVANPWCIQWSWCSPLLTTGSSISRVSIYGGHPHFWEHLRLAPRGTEAYHHPSMSLREPHTTQVYNCFKPQNRRASAQISDKLRFWSRICGECHEASPPIKPHAPLTFPLLEQLPATTNVSCNTLCERT